MLDSDDSSLPEFPRALKQAIALQVIALLYRRHHRHQKMRIVEMHPAGGMYDCLALTIERGPTLCIFNLAGSSLLLDHCDTPRPPEGAGDMWHQNQWRYPTAYLQHGGGVGLTNQLEERMGLPHGRQLPPATPSSVSLTVLAQLAQRYALSRSPPIFRSGWYDSSGLGGSHVRPWVAWNPKLQKRCDQATEWPECLRAAGRMWAIASQEELHEQQVKAVVDLGEGTVYRNACAVGSLWTRYQKGEGIRALSWWLEEAWRA